MFDLRHRRSRAALQLLLTILVIPFVFPLVAMVQGSLAGLGWGNYQTVLSLGQLPRLFVNSAVVSVGVIAIVLACALTSAFGFSKLGIRGREIYFWMLLACLLAIFVLALGRWPRPSDPRDPLLVLVALALYWLAIPHAGVRGRLPHPSWPVRPATAG